MVRVEVRVADAACEALHVVQLARAAQHRLVDGQRAVAAAVVQQRTPVRLAVHQPLALHHHPTTTTAHTAAQTRGMIALPLVGRALHLTHPHRQLAQAAGPCELEEVLRAVRTSVVVCEVGIGELRRALAAVEVLGVVEAAQCFHAGSGDELRAAAAVGVRVVLGAEQLRALALERGLGERRQACGALHVLLVVVEGGAAHRVGDHHAPLGRQDGVGARTAAREGGGGGWGRWEREGGDEGGGEGGGGGCCGSGEGGLGCVGGVGGGGGRVQGSGVGRSVSGGGRGRRKAGVQQLAACTGSEGQRESGEVHGAGGGRRGGGQGGQEQSGGRGAGGRRGGRGGGGGGGGGGGQRGGVWVVMVAGCSVGVCFAGRGGLEGGAVAVRLVGLAGGGEGGRGGGEGGGGHRRARRGGGGRRLLRGCGDGALVRGRRGAGGRGGRGGGRRGGRGAGHRGGRHLAGLPVADAGGCRGGQHLRHGAALRPRARWEAERGSRPAHTGQRQ